MQTLAQLGKRLAVKRPRGILKIAAIGLVLFLAVALVGNAVLIWILGSPLKERLAAIRNAGEPVTLADLARPVPPPEQNAAVVLRRAHDDVKALAKELNRIDASSTEQAGSNGSAEQKAIRAALDAHPRVLPLLEQAAACPDYNPELPYATGPQTLQNSLLTDLQEFRNYANILRAQASALRAQGKRDEALHTCLVSFRLTHHLEREPLLIPYLVVAACRSVAIGEVNATLRAGPVSDGLRRELDQELVASGKVHGYLQALKGERAYGLSSFGTTIPVNWLNRAYWDNEQCRLIDLFNEQMDLVTEPYAAVKASETKWIKQLGSFHPLVTLEVPVVIKTREAMDRVRAQLRCLRILNALQQHGPWQDKQPKLSELGLPPEAITDPFDGSLIKLKQVNGEWLIYCVGPSLQDHGGQVGSSMGIGLGPLPAATNTATSSSAP
jgi:hypothetical protein